ncbi:MAG TPA: proline--tRNA ligase [Candidatus Marinimicrobia bacterium]|nr:proline--tRNA ligase [Candidatus Neomarinimicrobiota bacterium]HIO89830.1 proline--tRNA ligase [Candidatus Neomarinimicrobiota bacterium]
MSKGVTSKKEDFARWYTDIITKAELADYGPVKGTMVIRPYGYSIWTSLKEAFDRRFQETGHVNAYFPLLIPKSFLSKEAEHVKGFAKECAVVTHHRLMANPNGEGLVVDPDSKLEEEVILRPTSETVIWSMYKKWIQSYRDLPILINQWANVVRWEMRTRLFLRTTEFLWQEGHTAHATPEEAEEEARKILDIYREVLEDVMAIPVLTGLKTEAEKFAGAVHTYCIETMMGDKRALQAGTSHNLGQNFAKAFDVTFQTEGNKLEHVYATSWGVSTRLIGALIMVHGDEKGLRLPPAIAPHQVVVVPIGKSDEDFSAIKDYLATALTALNNDGIRVHVDDRLTVSAGFKFHEWEMKGAPLRLEVGARDMEKGSAVIVRRDTGEKSFIQRDNLVQEVPKLLEEIQSGLFQQAVTFRKENTATVENYDEFKKKISTEGGFIRCGWDGDPETEAAIREETKASIRLIPFDEKPEGISCIYSGKPAKHEVIFAKAY